MQALELLRLKKKESTFWVKGTLNSAEIKPAALASIKLYLSICITH